MHIYGTLADKHTLKGLLVDLEPPSFDWKYQLRPPGSLKAGESKTFVVDGEMKKTGKQTLRNVKIKCRLYQQNSPNDASGELTLTEIKPGQVLPFLFHVDFFNFQYLGATSAAEGGDAGGGVRVLGRRARVPVCWCRVSNKRNVILSVLAKDLRRTPAGPDPSGVSCGSRRPRQHRFLVAP